MPRRHTVTVPVLAALLVTAPSWDAVISAPRHFAASAATEPVVERIGFSRAGENDPQVIRRLSTALDRMTEAGEPVFDFTNSPGLFHYVLDRPTPTRYYHVSYAIRQRTQSDLIRRLRSRPPEVVVLDSHDVPTSLSSWDGIANQVRHYEVSEYLFENYVPVAGIDGFVLARLRREAPSTNPGSVVSPQHCDWGYVPNFFSPTPTAGANAVRVPFRRSADGQRFVLTVPPSVAEYRWLELSTGAPLAATGFTLGERLESDEGSITWRQLDRGEVTARVRVGACSQWRSYGPGPLYLTTNGAQDVDRIRLSR